MIIPRAGCSPAARLCREQEMLELQQGGVRDGQNPGRKSHGAAGKESRNLFAEGPEEWAIVI